VEQAESRVSGMKDKMEEWDQTVKDYERMLRKCGTCKVSGTSWREKPMT
jgi:hypothetical protein